MNTPNVLRKTEKKLTNVTSVTALRAILANRGVAVLLGNTLMFIWLNDDRVDITTVNYYYISPLLLRKLYTNKILYNSSIMSFDTVKLSELIE